MKTVGPNVRTIRASPEFIRLLLAKLQAPLPYGFVGHDHTRLGQALFNIAIAQRKTKRAPTRHDQ